MTDNDNFLQDSGFGPTHYIEGQASIANLYKRSDRCGIYILSFSNGEYYVGQAIDVTRRYVSHRKNHPDVQKISFKKVKQVDLNTMERETIKNFERRGLPTRNIALTEIPEGGTDFDLIMPEEKQTEWLSNPELVLLGDTRPVNPVLRAKSHRQYLELLGMEDAETAIAVLHEYVRTGIPVIKSSEISFWGCSCLPQKKGDIKTYARININWQEVFAVFHEKHGCFFSWHLALKPLEDVYGKRLLGLKWKFRKIIIERDRYKPGGDDQICLAALNAETALKMLGDPAIIRATRIFNLRLMKKGPCNWKRNHCLDLADRLVE